MHELTTIARNLAAANTLTVGATRLERDVFRLLKLREAVCMWIDWPRRTVMTTTGALEGQVHDLVLEVAGTGRAWLTGSTLFQPIGPAPARMLLAMRRPAGTSFGEIERTMIATLATGLAPTFDRLIAATR